MCDHACFSIKIKHFLFFRFVQYGSKATWHYMEKNNFDAKSVEKFRDLEQSLAAFRKGKHQAQLLINIDDITFSV